MNPLESWISWAGDVWVKLSSPWTIYQFIIIVVAFLVAKLLAKKLEPWCESKVRLIKGKPGLLRFLVALLRNIHWLVLFILLCGVYGVLQQITWPSRSYFIGVAARLSLAWVAITVFSKLIRNRSLSRLVAFGCWLLVALGMVGHLDTAATALDSIAFTAGDIRLSLLRVLQGSALIIALLWIASSLGGFLERKINQSDDLTPSLKVLAGKIVNIVLLVLAVLMSLSSIGIDLTALAVFSGAVGVGLGFGLQKVVSNFISGIIILLDKSIEPGDTISLGDTYGWIRELRARFVSVVTRDGREYLIPNEDLITQQVVNWSFTDNMIRIDVPFGVDYSSNPHEVSRLAIDACTDIDRVSKARTPVCWMTEFGDSSLNFLLRFWIEDPQNGLTNIRGRVLLALWDTFDENAINIPFPHREIIIKGATPPNLNAEFIQQTADQKIHD